MDCFAHCPFQNLLLHQPQNVLNLSAQYCRGLESKNIIQVCWSLFQKFFLLFVAHRHMAMNNKGRHVRYLGASWNLSESFRIRGESLKGFSSKMALGKKIAANMLVVYIHMGANLWGVYIYMISLGDPSRGVSWGNTWVPRPGKILKGEYLLKECLGRISGVYLRGI